MKLSTIKELVSFMYYMEDYIFDDEIYKFALGTYEIFKKIINKPSK